MKTFLQSLLAVGILTFIIVGGAINGAHQERLEAACEQRGGKLVMPYAPTAKQICVRPNSLISISDVR